MIADTRRRFPTQRYSDGPAAAGAVLEKGASVRALEKSGSNNYWKGVVHDINIDGTYDVRWWQDDGISDVRAIRRSVPPRQMLAGWEGWTGHPGAPAASRIIQAGPATEASPPVRVMTASDGGGGGSRAAKRGRGDTSMGGVDAPAGAAQSEAVPVRVGEVVMLEHLGIESVEVLPPPAPGTGVVDDMAQRMVFTIAYTAQEGEEPSTMRVSLKDMVQSDTNIHLNALVDHMKLLSLGNPRRKDFDQLFQGVEPFPLEDVEALRRDKELARHAACRRCQHCKDKAKEAVPDCPSSEDEQSDSSSEE